MARKRAPVGCSVLQTMKLWMHLTSTTPAPPVMKKMKHGGRRGRTGCGCSSGGGGGMRGAPRLGTAARPRPHRGARGGRRGEQRGGGGDSMRGASRLGSSR